MLWDFALKEKWDCLAAISYELEDYFEQDWLPYIVLTF